MFAIEHVGLDGASDSGAAICLHIRFPYKAFRRGISRAAIKLSGLGEKVMIIFTAKDIWL